jgi:hypothetical protein
MGGYIGGGGKGSENWRSSSGTGTVFPQNSHLIVALLPSGESGAPQLGQLNDDDMASYPFETVSIDYRPRMKKFC